MNFLSYFKTEDLYEVGDKDNVYYPADEGLLLDSTKKQRKFLDQVAEDALEKGYTQIKVSAKSDLLDSLQCEYDKMYDETFHTDEKKEKRSHDKRFVSIAAPFMMLVTAGLYHTDLMNYEYTSAASNNDFGFGLVTAAFTIPMIGGMYFINRNKKKSIRQHALKKFSFELS